MLMRKEARMHVAIVHRAMLRAVASGEKTMESRMSLARRLPFGRVRAGDCLFLIADVGAKVLCARVGRVYSFWNMTPRRVLEIQSMFEDRIRAGRAYWRSKRSCVYATFIELEGVHAPATWPDYRAMRREGSRHAWFVLGQVGADQRASDSSHASTSFPNCSPASMR